MACRQLCSSRDSHPLLNVVHQPSQCAQQHGVHGTDAHVCAQVVGKLCNACHLVATAAPTIAKSDAHLVISGLVEKMSDVKVKPCAFELLTSLAEVRCACARDSAMLVVLSIQLCCVQALADDKVCSLDPCAYPTAL